MTMLPDIDRCADGGYAQPAILSQLFALLPRGRAWATRDGEPPAGSVLRGFWSAAASVVAALEARICALREEFWCVTQSETRDLWLAKYGLPDACDPFSDLCAKVAALGGQDCAYLEAVAARAGWSVACAPDLSARTGCMQAGCAAPGPGDPSASLRLRVNLAASPAYGGGMQRPFLAGRALAAQPLACGPDIGPLQCLLARVLPAHLLIIWEIA